MVFDRHIGIDENYDLPIPVRDRITGRLETAQGVVYPDGAGVGAVTLAALQAGCDEAAATGRRVWAAGTITTSSTLLLKSDADLSGLTINYTGSGVAVQLGDQAGYVRRLNVKLPKIIAANKIAPGWAAVAGTIGVFAVNLDSCSEVVVPHVQGFETGLSVYGKGRGNAYNTFLIGHLDNNKRNLLLSADATGWANQNTFIGGRYSHNSAEGANVSGARHVLMTAGLANAINNNTWINASLEADTAEYLVDFAGTANLFLDGRWEATTPRVRWQNSTVRCLILWGYKAEDIVETFGASASTNTILASTFKFTNSSPAPIMQLENTSSAANGSMGIYEPAFRASGADPATGYAALFTAQAARFKRGAEAFDRIMIDAVNSRVYFGSGAATPAKYFSNFGTTGISINAANLVFGTDNTNDIGAAGANRPRYVRAGTAVVSGAVATGSRPAAATAGAGAMVFDTTLNKPVFSDGTAWRDAAGTVV